MVMWNYCGTLMYADLYCHMYLDRGCGEIRIPVSEREFQTYLVHIEDDPKGSNARNHHTCVVPARYKPLSPYDEP